MPHSATPWPVRRGSSLFFGLLAAVIGGACGAPQPVVTEVQVADLPVAETPSAEPAEPTGTEEPALPRPKRPPKGPPRSAPVSEAPVDRAPTDVDRAKELFKLGLSAYTSGDYANARLQFQAAYAIVPENALLFNIASAELKMGQTSAACSHFREYVTRGGPSDPRIQEVRQQIANRCP